MSGKNRGYDYVVAASIYVVEALKDQGIARWNYPLRCLHRRLENHLRPAAARSAAKASGGSASEVSDQVRETMRQRKTQETVNKVMELNCWGPSTTRF